MSINPPVTPSSTFGQPPEGRLYPLNKYIDFDSIDHPPDETVIKILAEYKRLNKKKLEQDERTRLNTQLLKACKLGKYK